MGAKLRSLADRLQSQLADRGWSQLELARRTRELTGEIRGTSDSAIRQYCTGDIYSARPEVVDAMARALGVRVEWLEHGRGEPTEQKERLRRIMEAGPDALRDPSLRGSLWLPAAIQAAEAIRERMLKGGLSEVPPEWLEATRAAIAGAARPGWLALLYSSPALFLAVEERFRQSSPYLAAMVHRPEDFGLIPDTVLAVALAPLAFLGVDLDPQDPEVQRWLLLQLSVLLNAPFPAHMRED